MLTAGIDLTAARINQAGTGRYIRGLLEGFRQSNLPEPMGFESPAWTTRKPGGRLAGRIQALYRDVLWTPVQLPRKAVRADIDVLHMPANVAAAASSCPQVVTILDTTVFDQGHSFKRWHHMVTRAGMCRAARHASAILTISEFSRGRIAAVLGIPLDRITVTYCGCDASFRRLTDRQREHERARSGWDEFMLTVGTIEPRKNLRTLLRAYALMRREGYRGSLIHAGPKGWKSRDLDPLLSELNLRDPVRFLGLVPDKTLVLLYNLATVVAYPSLMEGFGLPVLEAMACGAPVVAATGSSLEEVGGEAAIYAAPTDVEALADALLHVASSPALQASMAAAGPLRATQFSWAECARRTQTVYEQVVS